MFLSFLQAIAFVTGMAAYYCAFFMYEDEQGKLLNRIDQLWIAIDDRKRVTGGMSPAILNKVAGVITHAFDRIFGQKLFSFQLVGVSVSYSIAGVCLISTALLASTYVRHQTLSSGTPLDAMDLSFAIASFGILGIIFFVLGTLPSLKRSFITISLSFIPVILVIIAASVSFMRHNLPIGQQIGVFVALVLSCLSDVALLAVVRVTLRKLTRESQTWRISAAIAVQIAIFALLVLTPWPFMKYQGTIALQILVTLSLFNAFTGLAASIFLITLLFVLLHRVFWPIVDRIVYPVAARRVLGNHKLMASTGTAMMAFASPLAWRIFRSVVMRFGPIG